MNELIECAKKDYDAIHTLMKNKSTDEYFLTIVCYLYQQSAEKLLKALIALRGRKFPYTHDIDELVAVCTELGYTMPSELDLAGAMLTNWEAKTRYKASIKVTIQQLDIAENIYKELFRIAVTECEKTYEVQKINCFGDNAE